MSEHRDPHLLELDIVARRRTSGSLVTVGSLPAKRLVSLSDRRTCTQTRFVLFLSFPKQSAAV
jgi:hypothetical protein